MIFALAEAKARDTSYLPNQYQRCYQFYKQISLTIVLRSGYSPNTQRTTRDKCNPALEIVQLLFRADQ
jgi:hypothetical protein